MFLKISDGYNCNCFNCSDKHTFILWESKFAAFGMRMLCWTDGGGYVNA